MQYNKEYEKLFEKFDKKKAFDTLAELFYDRNFATTSKGSIIKPVVRQKRRQSKPEPV